MNILYGVVGEGMGHATRSSVIIEHLLQRGHNVRAVASQRAYHFLKARFENVGEIHGLHIRYDDDGVQRRRTFLSNLLELPENIATNVGQYFEMLGSFSPDLVISDFDSFAYLYATNHRLPLVSIDNMQVLNRCRHESLPSTHRTDFQLSKALVKSKLPGAAHYFITTFFYPPLRKRRTSLYPPILRRAIVNAQREEGEHIVVYQTASTMNNLLPALQRLSNHRFKVYGLNREEDLGNVTVHKFSEEGFIRDLASCRGVVANGGFTLMSESVYLRKPVLSVPVQGQFEQILNAHYLQSLGYGEYWDTLDEDLLVHFLRNIPRYQANLQMYHQDGNSKIFAALDEYLPIIAEGGKILDGDAEFDGED